MRGKECLPAHTSIRGRGLWLWHSHKGVTSLIERKFPYVKATTSLDDILTDETVKGVFVSASPAAHFSIALRVLESGKSLFIEKPPCQSLQELDALIDKQ